MKDITIDNRIFQYEITTYECGSIGYETKFYQGTTSLIKKKYILFGKEYVVEEPKYAFSINCNIETLYLSKEKVKELINEQLIIFDRKLEIEKGDVI